MRFFLLLLPSDRLRAALSSVVAPMIVIGLITKSEDDDTMIESLFTTPCFCIPSVVLVMSSLISFAEVLTSSLLRLEIACFESMRVRLPQEAAATVGTAVVIIVDEEDDMAEVMGATGMIGAAAGAAPVAVLAVVGLLVLVLVSVVEATVLVTTADEPLVLVASALMSLGAVDECGGKV